MKPCPFCGNEYPTISQNSYGVTIRCPQCQSAFSLDGTCGRDYDKDATIAAWNRRTGDWMDAAIEVPVHNDDVLVYGQDEEDGAYIDLAYHKSDRWHGTSDGVCLDSVTHWMPLPDVPEEKLPHKLQCVYCGNTDEDKLIEDRGVHLCPLCHAELKAR